MIGALCSLLMLMHPYPVLYRTIVGLCKGMFGAAMASMFGYFSEFGSGWSYPSVNPSATPRRNAPTLPTTHHSPSHPPLYPTTTIVATYSACSPPSQDMFRACLEKAIVYGVRLKCLISPFVLRWSVGTVLCDNTVFRPVCVWSRGHVIMP